MKGNNSFSENQHRPRLIQLLQSYLNSHTCFNLCFLPTRLNKSVFFESLIVLYLSLILLIVFRASNFWYEFFFYLTLQGWALELIYFAYSLFIDVLFHPYRQQSGATSFAEIAAGALAELVFVLQIVIVVFFWTVVYPQEQWRSIIWEFNCHGMGLLLIGADYLYRCRGFSLRNHKYIISFSVFYTCLYMFVVLYLKRQVYPGIDFRSTRSMVIFSAGLLSALLIHKAFYIITNWKYIKEEAKTIRGISALILLRQTSIDLLIKSPQSLETDFLLLPMHTTAQRCTSGSNE